MTRQEDRPIRPGAGALAAVLIAAVVFMVIIWLSIFIHAMQIPLSHDEHQFIAAGRLAASGLLPYRDFPSNHMPYLTLLYAAAYRFTDWSLLPARLISALSAALTAVLVFSMTSSFFRDRRGVIRFAVSAGASLLLITNPIFRYTSGRAWNHDLPTLFTLIGVAFFLRAGAEARRSRWILASGAMIGLALGVRLTYLLAFAAFLPAIWMGRGQDAPRERAWDVGAFSLGTTLASLPWLGLFAAAPRPFVFGNITYQTLNTDYRGLLGHKVGETVLGKAVYFYHLLLDRPANLILFLASASVVLWLGWRSIRRRRGPPTTTVLLGSLALVLLASAFVATPSWYQYFYAPVPFVILVGASALSHVWPAGARWDRSLAAGALIVVLLGGMAVVRQDDWGSLRAADTWVPVQAHDLGREVRSWVTKGKVLTLAPTFPLEGGLGIFKELATGPFSWRIAPLLTEEKRREIGLLAFADLESALRLDPPVAIMVGFEAGNEGFELGSKGGLETPLEDYARDHGYSLVILPTSLMESEVRLWLR